MKRDAILYSMVRKLSLMRGAYNRVKEKQLQTILGEALPAKNSQHKGPEMDGQWVPEVSEAHHGLTSSVLGAETGEEAETWEGTYYGPGLSGKER